MAPNLDSTFAALADPTRRGVIDRLRLRPLCAGDLAAALRMSPPAMSRHLRVLRRTGLVEEQRADVQDARLRVYRLRPECFQELREWLLQVEGFWAEQLDAFKTHTERGGKGRNR